jgi:hypothetical protein
MLSASLIHLTMVGRDLACSTHDEGDASIATGAAAATHHPASHDTDQREQENTRTAPGLPPCCLMFASCVVAVTRAAEVQVQPKPFAASATSAIAAIPKSRTFGPEPPPPKA